MKTLTAAVLRHRALVALAWVVLTVVGGLFVGSANSGLSHKLATPGLAGYDTNQAMVRQLGLDGGEAPAIAVLHLPADRRCAQRSARRRQPACLRRRRRRVTSGLSTTEPHTIVG